MAQRRFRGRTEHNLDAKGRLNFPSRFREVLRQYDSEWIVLTFWGDHLRVYPDSVWTVMEDELIARGKEQPELAKRVRLVMDWVYESPLDKQGRILVPAELRNIAGISKEVVVRGMAKWVDVWDKKTWTRVHQADSKELGAEADGMAKLGFL
ncbi:MAG: division/cell wall cluster transcriptional repressor MraZ [Thermodesulfobacteriota bacterium]